MTNKANKTWIKWNSKMLVNNTFLLAHLDPFDKYRCTRKESLNITWKSTKLLRSRRRSNIHAARKQPDTLNWPCICFLYEGWGVGKEALCSYRASLFHLLPIFFLPLSFWLVFWRGKQRQVLFCGWRFPVGGDERKIKTWLQMWQINCRSRISSKCLADQTRKGSFISEFQKILRSRAIKWTRFYHFIIFLREISFLLTVTLLRVSTSNVCIMFLFNSWTVKWAAWASIFAGQ